METLQNVESAWSAEFQEGLMAYGGFENMWPEVARVYESRERTTNMAILLGDAQVREWRTGDTRDVDHFAAESYEIGIRKWALTAGVPKTYLDYDELNIVADKIGDLPDQIQPHYDDLVWDTMFGGFANACWDGQIFFSAAHPYATDENGAATYSNLITQALSPAAAEAALIRLKSIRKAYNNDVWNRCHEGKVKCFVAPSNGPLAREIFRPNVSGLAWNKLGGMAEVIEVGSLSAHPTYWYLWDSSLNHKPIFLKVNRRMDELVVLDQPRDQNVFWQDEIIAGVVGEHEIDYFLPQCIIGCHP